MKELYLKIKFFDRLNNIISESYRLILMKNYVFDYFDGFIPCKYGDDGEFINNLYKFLIVVKIDEILMRRRL